ncbi:lipopolysaccharide biosynthesis protein [Streptococcus suis]|uniref:lipopolysaccharide biosynthesis protein n=1 Tax=Streptococcus suis TaxID=1307 RepID=UPI0015D4EBF9|nr:oligosaccharide flippase family protein [Streptococcus suis]
MSAYKKLINNSIVFALGNLGSKVVSFILVPFYTYYLTTEQYGISDLLLTTVSLLVPIFFFSVYDAVLRFVLDSGYDNKRILSNSLIIGLIGFIFSLVLLPLVLLTDFKPYVLHFYLILLFTFFQNLFGQYARAKGYVRLFSLNGILLTAFLASFSILFIVVFHQGLTGFFWAQILAYLFSDVVLFLGSKAYKDISLKFINRKEIKSLLSYSVPLIPNSVMWWIVNASSRYFILFFSGTYLTGLFAVASKLPALLGILNQIFMQAWQISAIEEKGAEESNTYYTTVFGAFASLLFVITSMLTIVIKFVFGILFAPSYFSAWTVVPLLALGTVFSNFSAFIGTNYIVAKKTGGVFKTSVYGGIVSLLLNLILIKVFGLIGAGLSAMISFYIVFILRYFDTRKFINMRIDWLQIHGSVLLIILQLVILSLNLTIVSTYLMQLACFVVILYLNRGLFVQLLNKFIRKQ